MNWHGVIGVWRPSACSPLGHRNDLVATMPARTSRTMRKEMSWTTPELDTLLGSAPAAPASEHAGHTAPAVPVADPATTGPSDVDRVWRGPR